MATGYSSEELLDFLIHAGDRGLVPAASASALAVASRRILEILSADEKADLRRLDVKAAIKRFGNKRAKDFNPSSLQEYGRRFQRALDLFTQWRDAPASFSVPTRATKAARRRATAPGTIEPQVENDTPIPVAAARTSVFQSSFPVRSGTVVTIVNIPADLTRGEAERLAQFVRMLAPDIES